MASDKIGMGCVSPLGARNSSQPRVTQITLVIGSQNKVKRHECERGADMGRKDECGGMSDQKVSYAGIKLSKNKFK